MFSIRNILIGAFLVFSIALVSLVGESTSKAYLSYRAYRQIDTLAQLDKALFTALLNFRSERGDSATALTLSKDAGSGSVASVEAARTKVDIAMADAFVVADNLRTDQARSTLATTNAIFDRVKDLRQTVNRELKLDLDARQKGLDKVVLNIGNEFLAILESASVAVESEIRTLDPSMVTMIQIRSHAWSARAFGGTSTVILNTPIAAGRPIDSSEAAGLATSDGGATFSWNAVKLLVNHSTTPTSLKAAFDKANNGYFNGEFADWRKSIISQLRAGQPSSAGIDEWRSRVTPALGLVAAVASTAMDHLKGDAESAVSSALQTLRINALALVAVVGLGIGGMVLVVRRVIRPLSQITQCMTSLSTGDLTVQVPGTHRRDEVGAIAHSVEIFREAALRNRELETEAELNRSAAERDRIELQRRAETEAEDRLSRATSELANGLRRLAGGDLECEIGQPFAAQFEPLRHDFNTSVNQLRQTLLAIGTCAATVDSGAREVSNASDNLSKRTEQQAASLEETAAALEEITSNVIGTSKRTGEARDIVRNASTRADNSSKVMGDAVTAMRRIEESSKQIGQIIGVIDEIAFQTNLLALNAGVEAARAGEAGKGFAVVAQEVRELAQRSATAAREIKSLISSSAVAVGEGARLVADTGEGMADIAKLILAVNTHMDAIAAAAQEQSAGLSEINTAINHMDQATQQNAAMVEEMNAAGAGLSQESGTLNALLSAFALRREDQGGGELQRVASSMRHRAGSINGQYRGGVNSSRGTPGAAKAQAVNDWEEF